MKEIYNGETVALGGVNLLTREVIVDDSTGERAKFTYDKTTGSITVLDEVDPDSVNPVTARAVAQAVAGASGEVPVIGDNDNGKVLKAVVNGGQKSAEWGEAAPAVTVDQTYNASSTNAQSGTSVAQAIASVPSSSYTAGDGIEISNNNKIAVRAGKNLDFANTLVATQLYSPLYEYHGNWAWSVIGPLNMTRIVQLRQGMTIKMKAGATLAMTGADGGAHFAICRKDSANGPEISGGCFVLVADAALTTDTSRNFVIREGDTFVADFSSLSEKSVGSFNDIDDDNVDEFYLTVLSYSAYTTVNNSRYITGPIWDYPGDLVNTAEYYTENPAVKELVAVDQLPASTSADENKVLTVNSFGVPNWANAPSYNAGDGLSLAGNAFNVNAGAGLAIGNSASTRTVNMTGTILYPGFRVGTSLTLMSQDYCAALNAGPVTVYVADLGIAQWNFADTSTQFLLNGYFAICGKDHNDMADYTDRLVLTQLPGQYSLDNPQVPAGNYSVDLNDVNTSLSTITWSQVEANPENYCFRFIAGSGSTWKIAFANNVSSNSFTSGTMTGTFNTPNSVYVEHPLPSYTSADSGKVLQVQNDGTLAWVTLS